MSEREVQASKHMRTKIREECTEKWKFMVFYKTSLGPPPCKTPYFHIYGVDCLCDGMNDLCVGDGMNRLWREIRWKEGIKPKSRHNTAPRPGQEYRIHPNTTMGGTHKYKTQICCIFFDLGASKVKVNHQH